jgi:hypothetical protein
VTLPHALGARTVRIQVLAVYASPDATTAAITEVEFFAVP